MFWYGLIGLVFYYVYVKVIKRHQFWKKYDIAQPSSLSILNEYLQTIIFKKKTFLEETLDKYNEFPGKRYYGSYQFFQPVLVIKDLELVKQITIKDFDFFTDHRNFIDEKVDPLFGKNLFSLRGNKWRHMRVTLSPAFTSSKMKAMFTLMMECAEEFVEHFKKQTKETAVVEMKDIFTRYTNDIIATSAFGIKVDSLKEPKNEFYLRGRETTKFTGLQSAKFFLYSMFPEVMSGLNIPLFPRKITNFFRQIVKDTMITREKQGIIRPDMIHLLMEARKGRLKHEETKEKGDAGYATVEESNVGKDTNVNVISQQLSDDDITAQALIFFFAGFETSSSVMTFMAYEIAINSHIQEELHKEIVEVSEKTTGKVTYEDIQQMKYLDQVVSETLRLWTPGFLIDRVCVKDFVIPSTKPGEEPFHVQKDWDILIPILGFHMDPQYFPNPDKFDPSRFSDENKRNIVPGSYMPFGVGPRSCIGSRFALLEIKALYFFLLKDFELKVVEKTQIPMKLKAGTLNMENENGMWLGLKPRT